jgi:hypothetical protein
MVKEPTQMVSGKAMLAEIMVKLLTQGLQAGHVDVGEQATEGGAVGQLVAPKERHERVGEGSQATEECFEGRLTAERITEEDSDKVDHVIVASATTSQADMLRNGRKDAAPSEMASQQDQFSEPGWNRRDILWVGVDVDRNH